MDVAVIVLAHNAAATLEAAVASALAQQVPIAQLCIVDLGSTDATPHVAAGLCEAQPLVQLHLHPGGGAAAALNQAWRAQTAQTVAFLSAADAFAPGKLQRQLAELQAHAFLGGVATHVAYLDPAGQPLPQGAATPHYNGSPDGKQLLRRMLVDVDSLCFSSIVVRRSVLARCAGFDPSLQHIWAHHLWLRLQAQSALRLLDQPLTQCRVPLDHVPAEQLRAHWNEAWNVLGHQTGALIQRYPVLAAHVDDLYAALIGCAYRAQDYSAADKYLRAKKSRGELTPCEALMLADCLMHQQSFVGANELLVQLHRQRQRFAPEDRARLDELVWKMVGIGHVLLDPFVASEGLGTPNGAFVAKQARLPELKPPA